MRGPIEDAVNTVAGALEKIVKECLGKPSNQALLGKTIQKFRWDSVLKVENKPIQVTFAPNGRRMVPMGLGNLVNGSWRVAGMFDPKTSELTLRPEIIRWPRTGGFTPRDWLVCQDGQEPVDSEGKPSTCELCKPGFFSRATQHCDARCG